MPLSEAMNKLIDSVLGRFLHHSVLVADGVDRAAVIQEIKKTAELAEAEAELSAWLGKSEADRRFEYDEYVARRTRARPTPSERHQKIDALEVEFNEIDWPMSLAHLRGAVLGEIGVERLFAEGTPRLQRRPVPDFETWCANEEESLQTEVAMAREEAASALRQLEADLAFLTRVDEFRSC